MMVLPTLVAALSGASAAGSGGGSAWPPQAWEEGDLSDLSLVDLALLASDLAPTKEARRQLEQSLSSLDDLSPDHTEATRVTLEGLAQARWHQMKALEGLDDRQRAILASADPDRPVPPGWDEVMAAVDHRELGKALLALESASTRALGILERINAEPGPSVAGALAEALGIPAPEPGPQTAAAPPTTEATAALVAHLSGGLDPTEQASLSDTLDSVPPQARAAVHTILEGLVPLASGVPLEPTAALLDLGAAVDEARGTLRIWSTAAMAAQLHHVRTGPGIVIPDADADRPPLHFGVPRLRDPAAPLPPAPSLAEALREVATVFGDHQTARDAEAHVAPLADALDPEAQAAVAQVLHQSARYIIAQKTAALVPPPPALAAQPDLLAAWAGMEDLPDPGSPDAQWLLSARPHLAAGLEAALAREDLLTAIQDAVTIIPTPHPSSPFSPASALPGLTAPASSHSSVPCDQERIRVPFSGPAYLHVDPCGGDDEWGEEGPALLVIDTGGDDVYTGAYGGAPFSLGSQSFTGEVVSPVAIHLDLGGSDIYDAGGHDCVLGAACAPTDSPQPHLAVLVDWQDDDADVQNEFRSDDRSQGYAGDGRSPGTGLLVERVGTRSRLSSEYAGGHHSQGATGLNANALALTTFQPSGVGALLRVVGREAEAEGSFRAEDHSQGSMDLQNAVEQGAVAALVNVAGADAGSHDAYFAGMNAQGSSNVQSTGADGTAAGGNAALFADVVGPGGRSDDHYRAGNRSRAHGEHAYFLDVLLPETVERDGLVGSSLVDEPDAGVPDVPPDGSPTLPLPDLDPSGSSTSVTVASTGTRSSSNDTYVLVGNNPEGNGVLRSTSPAPTTTALVMVSTDPPVLFVDVSGNDTYLYPSPNTVVGDNRMWNQPTGPLPAPVPTGVDSHHFHDVDGDLIPSFLEEQGNVKNRLGTSDEDPDNPHPTGRRVLLDLGSQHPFLNTTHALVLSLTGDTTYGTGFSSAVLLDLAGNDWHLGRTAAAAGPSTVGSYASSQNLLSLSLDLEGQDHYISTVNGTMGFGANGTAGILVDLGGSDHYHGGNYTQGVGESGLGVLVDLKGQGAVDEETNWFRADGSPAQGNGTGGFGLLVADGDHNTFDDGGEERPILPGGVWDQAPGEVRDAVEDPVVPVPDGVGLNNGGASYNGGDNGVPTVTFDWSGSSAPFVDAGAPHTFTATVQDPDEDRMEVCWSFDDGLPDEAGVVPRITLPCEWVEGAGTVEVQHAWENVPTDANDPTRDEFLEYGFDVVVTDTGGKQASDGDATTVRNLPPESAGDLRFPQGMTFGNEYAFQLPIVHRGDEPDPGADAAWIDWGDGVSSFYGITEVDWAKSQWGALAEIPVGTPGFPALPTVDFKSPSGGGLEDIIDGDPGTHITFKHTRQNGAAVSAPATVAVWFEGSRQIRQIGLNASHAGGDAPQIHLALDAVREDGSTEAVDVVTLSRTFSCRPCTWNYTTLPDARGLLLRQIVAPGDISTDHSFAVREISAWGPGATHEWDAAGTYPVDYTILDRYGGRSNATVKDVDISSGTTGGGPTEPLRLVDIGGRGEATHASLAWKQPYSLTFQSQANKDQDVFCVDWGDGPEDCGGSGMGYLLSNGENHTRTKSWEPGDWDIKVIYFPDGRPPDGSGGKPIHLTTVHVERAIDLVVHESRVRQSVPVSASPVSTPVNEANNPVPILFLTFEKDVDTWHEGLVDALERVTPYLATVDAGGNDRYVGRAASSLPVMMSPSNSAASGVVPVPSLLVDAGGDDHYLSEGNRTQAFATHYGVSLLMDIGGDDVFVAGGEAQAAATRGAATALVALGGRDTFNPVPSSHPAVAAASPRSPEPWLNLSEAFHADRPVGPGPDLVQGAAEDGVALLVTEGGLGLFHAGSRSQGHGIHQAPTPDHYLSPGADSGCGPLPGVPGGQPRTDTTGIMCRLGIGNYQDPVNNPGFYANFGQPPNSNTFFCQTGATIVPPTPAPGGNPISPLSYMPLLPCNGSSPTSNVLTAFINQGPRYGPGLGALVRLGGPALFDADHQAQGSAGVSGRGLFLDLDGGSALTARLRAQAFSVDGVAGTVLGGPSVLRLGDLGQAVLDEAPPTPGGPETGQSGPEGDTRPAAAVLLTFGKRDDACGPGTCGGSGQDIDVTGEYEVSPRLPGPTVTFLTDLTDLSPVTDDTVETVDIEIQGMDGPFEVVVFAIAFPEGDVTTDPCSGVPLAPPAVVLDLDDVPEGTTEVPLDLGALAGQEPLLPAGCTELHVFARPHLGTDVGGRVVATTDWGHGVGSVLLAPPPRGVRMVDVEGGVSTNGSKVEFLVEVPEPWSREGQTDAVIQFHAVHPQPPHNEVSGHSFFKTDWQSNGRLRVTWDPSGVNEGEYRLEARAEWNGMPPSSAWSAPLDGYLRVDKNPPQVDVTQVPSLVRARGDMILTGNATDVSGVRMVAFRLLNETGVVVPMETRCSANATVEAAFGQALSDAGAVACAALGTPIVGADGDKVVPWYASFRATDLFQAGNLTIQVNAVDGGGAVGSWEDVGTVLRDTAAPRVTSVLSFPAGTMAAGPSPGGNDTVRFRVHLCDGSNPDKKNPCTGDAVDLQTVTVSATRFKEDGTLERVPLSLESSAVESEHAILGYNWSSDQEIPEGTYGLFIMARDKAGNLLDHNPAWSFPVDRTLPELQAIDVDLDGFDDLQLPDMTLPDGTVVEQQAVKAGDVVGIVTRGSDANPHLLVARIPGDPDPLAEVAWTKPDRQVVSFSIPMGADRGTGIVELEVEALDLALNPATRMVSIPFTTPFALVGDPHVEARSDSVQVLWNLTRPLDASGDGMRAVLQDPNGFPLAVGDPQPAGEATYSVLFPDLDPGTPYQVALQLWDAANNTLEEVLPFSTFEEPAGATLRLTTATAPTYSGQVPVHGHLLAGTASIRGRLTLHLGDVETPPLPFATDPDASPQSALVVETTLGERKPFTLYWNSTGAVPADVGAQVVDLHVKFDDGTTSWNDTVSLRIDNAPPAITAVTVGPAPNDGWYNGTVVVRGAATDDNPLTPPSLPDGRPNLVYRTARGGGPLMDTDRITLTEDGAHTVRFSVSDGAFPPNTGVLTTVVRLDRTLPTLQLESGLDSPWTNRPLVPVAAVATDGGSGLDGYRIRAGDGPWTPWSASAPDEVSLEELGDGEHWIDVEVRDQAHNSHRETLAVTLDRVPPSLVDARWIGLSLEGEPVLHVVARDNLGGEGRPSGVAAIRFAPAADGPWPAWIDTDVSGVHPLQDAAGGVWLQLRDAVGNIGNATPVEAPPAANATSGSVDPEAPSPGLLGASTFTPGEGGPETAFTFSARILPLAGAFPDEVVLRVAGSDHAMHAEGPVLDDGSRFHSATVTLPASRLDAPHTFRIVAHYGDQVVEGTSTTGPTVFALGLQDADPEDGPSQKAPGPALVLLLIALIAFVPYQRRLRP